jgi:hypothetical protein
VPRWNIEHRTSLSQPESDAARVVALRFDKFELHKPTSGFLDGHVSLVLFNGGGNPDGSIHIGGCIAYYVVSRRNGEWIVEFVGSIDP